MTGVCERKGRHRSESKQEPLELMALRCPAKARESRCGGQRALCCNPGSAGGHCYSGPLSVIPGHAREAGAHW